MNDIQDKILFMVGEIKGEVTGIKEQMIKQNGILKDHQDRINKNESEIDKQKGRATAYGVIAGFFTALIASIIGYLKLK